MSDYAVNIILPERSRDAISDGLRFLTEYLRERGTPSSHGALGGENGYGAHYENDTFSMHPFYWGDECTDGCQFVSVDWEPHVQHTPECYQTELRAKEEAAGLGLIPTTWEYRTPNLTYDQRRNLENEIYKAMTKKYGLTMRGCAVHCTCDFMKRFDAFHATHGTPHIDKCAMVRPNFLHKKSGFTVRWYKWIGRDMEIENPKRAQFTKILKECLESLNPAP